MRSSFAWPSTRPFASRWRRSRERPQLSPRRAWSAISKSFKRRHLNAGQRAIMEALAYPEPRRGLHSELKFSTEVDKGDLSRARAIVKWAREWVDDQIEAIAKDIEALQATAFFRIAERLAEAHELFRYRRDEGGFAGWVEKRLRYSRATAYRLLDVHEKLGDKASQIETLSKSALYLLAAPSTPDEVREEAIERVEAGEQIPGQSTTAG